MVTATTEKKRQENGIFKRYFECFKTKTLIRKKLVYIHFSSKSDANSSYCHFTHFFK